MINKYFVFQQKKSINSSHNKYLQMGAEPSKVNKGSQQATKGSSKGLSQHSKGISLSSTPKSAKTAPENIFNDPNSKRKRNRNRSQNNHNIEQSDNKNQPLEQHNKPIQKNPNKNQSSTKPLNIKHPSPDTKQKSSFKSCFYYITRGCCYQSTKSLIHQPIASSKKTEGKNSITKATKRELIELSSKKGQDKIEDQNNHELKEVFYKPQNGGLKQFQKSKQQEKNEKVNCEIKQWITKVSSIMKQLSQESYKKVFQQYINSRCQELKNIKHQDLKIEQIEEIIEFRFQVSKYFYFHQEFKKALENMKQIMVFGQKVERCNYSIIKVKTFMLLISYHLKMIDGLRPKEKQTAITEEYTNIVRLLQKKESKHNKEILKFINTLVYHYELTQRFRIRSEMGQQWQVLNYQMKCYESLQKLSEIDKHSHCFYYQPQEKLIIGQPSSQIPSINRKAYQEHHFQIKSIKTYPQKNITITKQQRWNFIKDKLKSCMKLNNSFKLSEYLGKQKYYQDYVLLSVDDAAKITSSGQKYAEEIVVPYLNLKSIFINIRNDYQWINPFRHKLFFLVPLNIWNQIWKLTFAIPFQFIQSSQVKYYKLFDKVKPKQTPKIQQKLEPVVRSHIQSPNSIIKPHTVVKRQEPKNWRKIHNVLAGGRGLKNIGNTCYMNSVLQCLHKSINFNSQFHKNISKRRQIKPLTQEYIYLLNELDKQTHNPFVPKAIKSIVAENNEIFKYSQQNDALQFLNTFVSTIDDELNEVDPKKRVKIKVDHSKSSKEIFEQTVKRDEARSKSIVDEIFTGRYQTSYKCAKGHNYILYEKFNIQYIPIPVSKNGSCIGNSLSRQHKVTLLECLKQFEKTDRMQDQNEMHCEGCDKVVPLDKKTQIYDAGKILILGMKRFNNGEKDDTLVSFDKWIYPKDMLLNYKDEKYKDKVYNLYAIIVHYGSLYSGHYVAYCYNHKTDQWIYFSDEHVKQVTFQEVQRQKVYALFYELKDQKQLVQRMK